MKNVTAIYARLSREDENRYYGSSESKSIENQIKALSDYAREHDFVIYKVYYDDGWSGSTLDRPQFQQLLQDMRNHKFNTLLVKDMSRIGRSLHKVGDLIERVFPENHIRVISVSDHYDSLQYNDEMSIVLRSFLNQYYLRDLVKKCRKAREFYAHTKHMSYYPKYGYDFDSDRNEIIDEYSANIVRRIFDYVGNKGLSTFQVANILNEEGVLTRSMYSTQVLGHKGLHKVPAKQWNANKVWEIIKDYEYCGHSVNFACRKKEDWVILKNTHHALIDEELYERAQKAVYNRYKKKDYIDNIGKILKDRESNRTLFFCKDKPNYYYYRDRATMRNQYKIYADDIHNVVYKDVISMIQECKNDKFKIYNIYKNKLFNGNDYNPTIIKNQLKKLNEEYSSLLETYFNNNISEVIFENKSKKIRKAITELENKLNSCDENEEKIALFNIKFDRFLDSIKEIPQSKLDVIRLAVSSIYVNKKPINKNYDISIVYKFEE